MGKTTSLAAVRNEIGKARGLPNEHYTDPATFKEEAEAVLFANWAGIGFGKDVPDNGDVRPVEFLGVPLLVMRNHDGDIGVFQNTCRHRGMILVSEPKNLRNTVRCPYHSWCYSLEGELKATPHVGGPGHNTHELIQPAELGLIRIRSHVWRDVIFVNISGDAQEFEECHADLLQRWQEFEQPLYHGGVASSFRLDVKTNWKLAVENYCESYHLPWVHPGLNSYSKLEDHYDIQQPLQYSGQGTYVYRQLTGEYEQTLADFGDLSEQWNTGAEYIALYPNVLLGVHRDHSFAIILEPLDCVNTVEHIELYYATDADADDNRSVLRETNARLWKTVFEEDIDVVEGMQKGRKGILFDGGRFSPAMDGPTHNFHQWVATCLESSRAQRSSLDA